MKTGQLRNIYFQGRSLQPRITIQECEGYYVRSNDGKPLPVF